MSKNNVSNKIKVKLDDNVFEEVQISYIKKDGRQQEGIDTQAIGEASHSEGSNTIAEGNYSHAEGSETIASGYASHAEGSHTTASGLGAHSEGYKTIAEGDYSHAEGFQTNAFGNNSHAEGRGDSLPKSITAQSTDDEIYNAWKQSDKFTIAKGENSHTEGNNTLALGTASHAEGWVTAAIGRYAHVEGAYSKAEGTHSHAEGYTSYAQGDYSHAEGWRGEALGYASHAEGSSTTASGYYAHAEGTNTAASGDGSHAEGDSSVAAGKVSHAEGMDTIASGDFSHVQGKYNIEDTENKYAHIVGNGSFDESIEIATRSNAHTLDWDGNAWFAGDVKANHGIYMQGKQMPFIACGDKVVAGKVPAKGASSEQTVYFGCTFKQPPVIQLTISGNPTQLPEEYGLLNVSVIACASDYFTFKAYNAGTQQRAPSVYWTAIGILADDEN